MALGFFKVSSSLLPVCSPLRFSCSSEHGEDRFCTLQIRPFRPFAHPSPEHSHPPFFDGQPPTCVRTPSPLHFPPCLSFLITFPQFHFFLSEHVFFFLLPLLITSQPLRFPPPLSFAVARLWSLGGIDFPFSNFWSCKAFCQRISMVLGLCFLVSLFVLLTLYPPCWVSFSGHHCVCFFSLPFSSGGTFHTRFFFLVHPPPFEK